MAYWKRPSLAVTVDYGQAPAEAEIRAAAVIAEYLNIPHKIVRTDLRRLGTGALAKNQQLPIAPTPEWWPFRNQMLITLAAMSAIQANCSELVVGTVESDNLHNDGTPAFIETIDALLSQQEGGMRVRAPAAAMRTEDLIVSSGIPFSLLAWCHSCHVANLACGVCRGCQKSREARNAVGLIT